MSIAPATRSAFWQLQHQHPGQCEENLMNRVWTLNLGSQQDHWDLYCAYSQEELRHEVLSNWSRWQECHPRAAYVPWLWALKVYVWKYPLDTAFFDQMRHTMGPMWLLHVRHAQEDWQWLYNVKESMPVGVLAILLGSLAPHPIGQALAVCIPPVFEGYRSEEFSEEFSPHPKARKHAVQPSLAHWAYREPGLALLHRYGDVLLHPQAHFYPRWRALLVCLSNNAQHLEASTTSFKRSEKGKYALQVLSQACAWLGLRRKALTDGFDDAWVAFLQSKECQNLDTWDALVNEFSRPPTWQERLRSIKNAKAA